VKKKLDNLEKAKSTSAADALDNALDDVYNEVYEMNGTDEGNMPIIVRALKWMICAQRTLSIETLAAAASVDDTGQSKEDVNKVYILSICSNFIVEDSSRNAQFAHLSVQEYLQRRNEGKEYSFDQAHRQIATTCLAYMIHHRVQLDNWMSFSNDILDYSVVYWAYHWYNAAGKRLGDLGDRYDKFLRKNPESLLQRWVNLLPQIQSDKLWHVGSKSEPGCDIRSALSSPLNPIFSACVWGFTEVVDEWLKTYTPEECNNDGEPPLCIASRRGNLDIVRHLLMSNAVSIDSRDRIDWTALFCAVFNGHMDIVALLIEKGASVDSRDSSGRTPLAWAARANNKDIVALLIEKRASVDSLDNEGDTPLHHWASWNSIIIVRDDDDDESAFFPNCNEESTLASGYKDVIALLLKGGTFVDSRNNEGLTPLAKAAIYGGKGTISQLVENNAKVDSRDNKGLTPLALAAKYNSKDTMTQLIGDGAFINSRDDGGCTPLAWAARNGHNDAVAFLCGEQANCDLEDEKGRTPLLWAAKNGHYDVVVLLCSRGANINCKDKKDRTPLLRAATKGHENIVRFLLEIPGVEINSKDSKGRTALSRAVKLIRVVKLLLAHPEVKIESQDEDGWTALGNAVCVGSKLAVKLLLESGACPGSGYCGETALSLAVKKGRRDIIELLLDWPNVSIDSKDKDGRTPLSWAAQKGNLDAVKLLLAKGAYPDRRDDNGRTPLSFASEHGRDSVVRLLLENSTVDVNATDNSGWTALSWAAPALLPACRVYNRQSTKSSVAVLELLLRHGAKVDLKDSNGRTPLSWAVGKVTPEWGLSFVSETHRTLEALAIMRLLIKHGSDVNAKDQFGRTALSWAAEYARMAQIKEDYFVIVEDDSDIEEQDSDKDNSEDEPWLRKFQSRETNYPVELIGLLVQMGANVNFRDWSGRTPLQWAIEADNQEVVKVLSKYI
jgi:ankyrin repeat protein